jgi:hypothetical protein
LLSYSKVSKEKNMEVYMSDIRQLKGVINKRYYNKLNLDFSELIGKPWPGFPEECKGFIIKEVVFWKRNKSKQSNTYEKRCNETLFEADSTHAIVIVFSEEDPTSKNYYVVLQVVEDKVFKYSEGLMCYLLIDLPLEKRGDKLFLTIKKQGE